MSPIPKLKLCEHSLSYGKWDSFPSVRSTPEPDEQEPPYAVGEPSPSLGGRWARAFTLASTLRFSHLKGALGEGAVEQGQILN